MFCGLVWDVPFCAASSTLCALGVRDAYLISAGLVGLDPLIHAGTVGLLEMPVMAQAVRGLLGFLRGLQMPDKG